MVFCNYVVQEETVAETDRPVTSAELGEAVRDLQARVAALEHEPTQRPRRRRHAGLDLRLVDLLTELTEPPAEPGAASGTVAYGGVAHLGGDGLAWQMVHPVPKLLTLDEGNLARQLTALASPVRLRILRELAAGPLQTHELQARLDEPTAGQLYHHLRELLATGLVTQPRRSVYELPPRAVIPLLTLVACAHDLASAEPDGRETR
jgi:DNA-binding transcriptional ArsR family regulator